ncbi:glycosyltransferase family 2 protein [Polynucleobacter sp. P1-05-14]|uniref:glycosyltransferase family 2 protein n=1 Tax=Polynucleobacter sp. P1-05-14 TaxID=1819732 RepID=UPI001C0BE168|nr:glycosyltransferase family 2 protein [Polynucleobacter sp. P1-05-14]MBU3548019.1 glycosyltransferase family 2 protein [Polynucleobacter sp. P1-05-14]
MNKYKSTELTNIEPKFLGSKISVCILTYNHAHLIESTLKSILNQTINGYDIYISDDCSTDNTFDIIKELICNNDRIKLLKTPHNMGMAGNANFAIKNINKPYIALLHHDDICRTDLLEKWALALEKNEGAAFVFNPYGVYGSKTIFRWNIGEECMEGRWLLEKLLFPKWGCCVRGTAMIRRDAWLSVGGMREEFGMLADIDLWMRLSMKWQVAYVDEPVIAIRQERPDNYPVAYKENFWTWRRRQLLYEIHIANRLTYWDIDSFGGRLKWWKFRILLSFETFKWLSYAVIRKKPEMILTSKDSITKYDLMPLVILRWLLISIYRSKYNQ